MTMHLCIHGDVFTQTQRIVDWIAARTRWPVVTDQDLIEAASRRFDYPAGRLEHALSVPDGLLGRLNHGTERSVAYLRSVLADAIDNDTTIFHGAMGLLSPGHHPWLTRVLVAADPKFRIQRALESTSGNTQQVRKIIAHRDRNEFRLCRHLFGSERFDAEAYDLVVPSDRLDTEAAGSMILETMMRAEMRAGSAAADRIEDFKLAARIQTQLSDKGYPVSVDAKRGRVRVTIDRPVLFMDRLTKKLKRQVRQVSGVQEVVTRAGAGVFQADIYRRCRFDVPMEMAYRSFARCRRRLHARAADRLPATDRLREGQTERARAVQQFASLTSSHNA